MSDSGWWPCTVGPGGEFILATDPDAPDTPHTVGGGA